jgi:SnoaL-like protein
VATFPKQEIEEAFHHWWAVGNAGEDWNGWADLFTEDCTYTEHFWGTLYGREEVRAWIEPVMKGVPEVYGVLEWYVIGDDRVVFELQNRRDNPDSEGPPYFDFPGLSVIWYAGHGLWRAEEDYWAVNGARTTSEQFSAACGRADATFEDRLSRRHWPDGPAWARGANPPRPSWLDRPDVAPITRPRELVAILGRDPRVF